MKKRLRCPKCGELTWEKRETHPTLTRKYKGFQFIHETRPISLPRLGVGREIVRSCWVGDFCYWPRRGG